MKATVERSDESADAAEVERRRSERADYVVRVAYKTVDELFSEFARNINEGGLFVETEIPPGVGSLVALQFNIPGSDEPIQVMGRVVRTSAGERDEPPGMGIEFENLDGQSRELINDLVRNLRVGMPGAS
ncbi:MAG: TIGR02266 family protein [Myxococcales bacterium]|nr:TIGR02266 family protein [Myxococcales bacterium]MDH5307017.1 TIGR02266 family protein [Myxococcales bacterium]MDH5565928.1 TIGR02266 family protein [Myxococcales bacterium]